MGPATARGARFRLQARDEGSFPASSGKNSRRFDASQEEAHCTGKARGTHGSCHHSKSPPDVSVHSRGSCFPCTASTFTLRIDSHLVARVTTLWESLLGKPRVRASRERHRSLDPGEGKRDTAATAREESARACPHSSRGLTALGRLQKRFMKALERNPQVPAPTPHKILGAGIDRRGIPRGPRATRMGTGLSGGHQRGSLKSSS